MNQLEERLRNAGRSHTDITPDIQTIRNRGLRFRRNRQIATSVAAVALFAVGGVVALNLARPSDDTSIVSASEGELDGDGDGVSDSTDSTEPSPSESDDGSENDSDDGDTPVTTIPHGDASSTDADPDGDPGDGGASTGSESAQPQPSAASLSDGDGGWLTATSDGVAHLRSNGSQDVIRFSDPPGGFAQRWPTDVVTIDGRRYLLVDQFVNRQDLAAEKSRALAEEYGIGYDPDSEMSMELYDVATPQELSDLEHWEVAILAVDLDSHDVRVVENRVITSATSPEWIYNGHITARDGVILVMRELWQSACLYVEGLTIDGQPVAVSESEVFAKPAGVDDLTFDDIEALFAQEHPYPEPCATLSEVPDGGVAFLGTQAEPEQLLAFRQSFFEVGLG